MTRQLSDWDHVRGFLQLQRLVVCESGFGVDDEVRVQRAVFLLALELDSLAPPRQTPVRPAPEAPEPAWGVDDLGRAAGTTLEVQLGGAGGEDGGGDDDAGDADETRERIRLSDSVGATTRDWD